MFCRTARRVVQLKRSAADGDPPRGGVDQRRSGENGGAYDAAPSIDASDRQPRERRGGGSVEHERARTGFDERGVVHGSRL